MGGAAFRSLASARTLVAVIAAVIAFFVVSSATALYVESTSARQTDMIVGNAMPSIQFIAIVRGDLLAIDRAISSRHPHPTDELLAEIREKRRNMDAALTAYTALPFFPGEQPMYASVPDLLRDLDSKLAAIGDGIDDADDIARCRDTIDAIDEALQRLETFDASQGQRLGLEIAQTRARSRSFVWLLDAASVVLALGALALALRQRARALRVVELEYTATEHQLDELRAKVDELGQFAGRVAHDIRSPLQTAMLSLEMINDHSTIVTRAQRALHRMSVLVDGLLEFARAGAKPAPNASADIHGVLGELVTSLTADANAHGITLTAQTPAAGARVRCSAGVLTSIVANLANNAIRHMGDAPVRRVEILVTDAGARWRIEVRDSGPGIPPGEEQRIFQPHVQLAGREGGIGLGLATVERLVHAHSGDVGVTSPIEGGAIFWVELPRA